MARAKKNGVSPTRQEQWDREEEAKANVSKAHEIWAVAQLMPGEGIEDGVARIEKILEEK